MRFWHSLTPRGAAPARQGQFLAGDGIRGVGMISVIFAHLCPGALVIAGLYTAGMNVGVRMRTEYGTVPGILMSGLQLAVPMFFVLSAYLISRPWVRAYVLGRPTPSLGAYALHRTLRIVPVFWLLTTLTLIAFTLQGSVQGSGALDLVAVYGFGQVYHVSAASQFIGQAWTIDVEVAFYLLVPPSAWLITHATRRFTRRTGRELSERGRIALVVGLLAAATVASAYMRGATNPQSAWNISPPATFYYFGPGIALVALEIAFSGPVARRRIARLAPVLGLAAIFVALVLTRAESTDANAIVKSRGALAVALASGLALAALLARQLGRGDSPRWLDNGVTRWLGARSYPCYILQTATISAAALILGHTSTPWLELLILTAFVLPLTLAGGHLIHMTIEAPVLAWGHRRSHRPRVEAQLVPPPTGVGAGAEGAAGVPPSAASSAAPLGDPRPVQAS